MMVSKFKNQKIKVGFIIAVALSLFLHFGLGLGLWIYKPKVAESQNIEIKFVEQPPTPETIPNMPKVKDEAKQIVDQDDKALNNEIDEKAKFLSKNNQKVVHQTATRNHGDFQNRAAKSTVSGNGGEVKPIKLQDLTPKYDIAKAVRDRQEQEQAFDKDPEGYKTAHKKKEEEASKVTPEAAKPGTTGEQVSQTIDYVKDLDPGLETLLSTREFVYYTYYARIRRQLNQFWAPKVREKMIAMARTGRQPASSNDIITKCLVTLDKGGQLMKVQIVGVSGVHELDEAAVEAFKMAAPFPNPPHGIVETDGTIKLLWSFILEV